MGVALTISLWIGLETRQDEDIPLQLQSDVASIRRAAASYSIPTSIPVATPAPTLENMVLHPSPTPTMPVRNGDSGGFDGLLSSVFGASSSKAFRVADCEMGYKLSAGSDPFALNRTAVGSGGEVSIWQIHPIHFWKYDKERLKADLLYAAQATYEISEGGTVWTGTSRWSYCGWQ